MSRITALHGRQILDSRGYPTIEVEATLDSGVIERSAVPAGSSPGRLEAAELRDGGDRWSAMGVTRAVKAVEDEIATSLLGRDAQDQADIDRTLVALDGTPDKSRLGSNTTLGRRLPWPAQPRARSVCRCGGSSVAKAPCSCRCPCST